MNEIKVIDRTNIGGNDIAVIAGGFGEGKRCLTDKQIAEIHEVTTSDIRKAIHRNINRFKNSVDFIDLRSSSFDADLLKILGYSVQQIMQAKNIYLLSERGYAKLIKIMDSDKAWEIHDELIDNYFAMREVINSDDQLKAMALLKALEGTSAQDRLEGLNTYTEIKVKEETAPLIATIEEQKPDVNFAIKVQEDNQTTYSMSDTAKALKLGFGRNKLLANLRRENILMRGNEPYQRYVDQKYFIVKISDVGVKRVVTTRVTGKGLKYLDKIRDKIS